MPSCNTPSLPKEGNLEHFPIPERAMHTVCLDVFAMPPTQWQGQAYDSILLCVDRLSGWIVACPTLKVGLTAEKAAQLLMERGWEPFGVPATIHSDQGPQFVGQWWRTMCARLGVQQTFSQPHRPRANGKAERAGQQLLSIIKKLHLELGINWAEALPRALKIYHDAAGPGGYSPHNILFGRETILQGIPTSLRGLVKMHSTSLTGWTKLTAKSPGLWSWLMPNAKPKSTTIWRESPIPLDPCYRY